MLFLHALVVEVAIILVTGRQFFIAHEITAGLRNVHLRGAAVGINNEHVAVVDADGLNIMTQHPGMLRLLPKGCIVTPHLGEFKRLGKRSTNHFTALSEAREMAVMLGIYVVLKGHHTAICTPEGKTFFNATGNSGMATAGSGDVLTGMLTSLLAQGYTPLHPARNG